MPLPTKFWAEMAWTDFRDADTASAIAVLPVAAIEQHGPHRPVGVDTFIKEGYLRTAAARLPDDLSLLSLSVQAIGFRWMAQDVGPKGAMGDAASGTAAKGEAARESGAAAFIALLRDVERFDAGRLAEGPLGSDRSMRAGRTSRSSWSASVSILLASGWV